MKPPPHKSMRQIKIIKELGGCGCAMHYESATALFERPLGPATPRSARPYPLRLMRGEQRIDASIGVPIRRECSQHFGRGRRPTIACHSNDKTENGERSCQFALLKLRPASEQRQRKKWWR